MLWGRVGRDREDKRLMQRTKVLLGKSANQVGKDMKSHGGCLGPIAKAFDVSVEGELGVEENTQLPYSQRQHDG